MIKIQNLNIKMKNDNVKFKTSKKPDVVQKSNNFTF